jgi:hypothetical protein
MSRNAILIDAGQADETRPLRGTALDVRNFRDYLMSPIGGAWANEEIDPIGHPTIEQLLELIERANASEYVLFYFSGHGGYYGREMSILPSRRNGTMLHDIIRLITRPFTLIVDACRNTINEEVSLEMPDGGRLLTEGLDRIEEYRAAFDKAIRESTAPRAILYGCRRGQDAVDLSQSGGVFTTCLLNEAKNWAATRHGTAPRILTCSEALGMARPRVDMLGFEQTPTLDPMTGLGTHPPFAVWLPPR